MHLIFKVVSVLNTTFPAHSLTGFVLYVTCLWLTISLGAIFLFRKGIVWQNLGFINFRWSDLLWATVVTLIGFILFFVSQSLADRLNLPVYQVLDDYEGHAINLIIVIFVCVLIGPLGEEIIYRGFLLGWLWGLLRNPWLAGSLATLVFAIVHIPGFGLKGSLYILFWTPLIAALFIWRKSIYPCYAAHLINNLVAYILVPVLFT